MTALATTDPREISCPALESGDRMDAAEFHWRYERRPDIKKAELIDGVVYVASPVNFSKHGNPHFNLIRALGRYIDAQPGVAGADNASMLLGGMDEPQPDVALCWDSDHGGTAVFDDEGNLTSAADLVAEVSYSSHSYDLHDKKDLYLRIGVREYVVWQVEEGRIDWWELRGEEYVAFTPDERGVIESRVFPGLSLDTSALVAGVRPTKTRKRSRRTP